uniref:Histone-lysine N-methyltransferase SETMAR n=1 Tax=Heterorhabditis bacteriophora TaxID=37862 RepID=A0A1I7WBJ0_HETBA
MRFSVYELYSEVVPLHVSLNKSLEDEVCRCPLAIDNNQLTTITEADPRKTTREVAEELNVDQSTVILYDNRRCSAQWLDQDDVPKHFPNPKLHQKKFMVTVWWSASEIITTTFWILAKLSQRRSIARKSTKYTKNCNVYGQHWAIEKNQFFFMSMPDLMSPYSTDLYPPDYHFFKHLDN